MTILFNIKLIQEKNMKKALIAGSGLGGLTTALRLARHGYQVEMVEKFHQAGGRLNQLNKDGFSFDMAPTFFSMSYEFHEFCKDAQIEPPFKFTELDTLYTVHYRGSNKKYRIFKDIGLLAEEFKDVEPDFRQKMEKFLAQAGGFFHDVEHLVLKRNYESLWDFFITMTRVPPKYAPKLINSVWSELEKYFESNEVREIFSLVAFFLGATPFDTPAIYTLLSYTELVHDGYHNVEGGMYRIVEGLLEELKRKNINIHYNTEITGYEALNGSLKALIDQYGNKWEADLFVINADAAYFRNKVFKRKQFSDRHLEKMQWTMAPFTMYIGIDKKIPGIELHNYFLGNNFKEYSGKIFKNSITLDKPYYYVNVPSRTNPQSAPEGCESLFILVPVPDLRYKPNWDDREEIASNIIQDLSDRTRISIQDHIISKTILTPIEWEKTFNLYKGSGLGLGHKIKQIGGFRPKNYDEQYDNTYYVGSSTLPGTGLPMTVISSKLVVERIIKKYGFVHP